MTIRDTSGNINTINCHYFHHFVYFCNYIPAISIYIETTTGMINAEREGWKKSTLLRLVDLYGEIGGTDTLIVYNAEYK